MSENKRLKEYLKELYLIEKQARDLYNEFLVDLKDKQGIKIVKSIRNDEEKHMRIAKELIKIIS